MQVLNKDADLREKFLFTLEWLLAVMALQDNPAPQFYLARLAFGSYASMGEAFGAPQAAERLIAVESALRQLFHKSDLIVRDGVDLWLLTPVISSPDQLKEKLVALEARAAEMGLDVVDRDVDIFTLPNADLRQSPQESAAALLAHLSAEHERLALTKMHLPIVNN